MTNFEIHDRPQLIRYNERGATEPYDPCEVFPPELTESSRKMTRILARGGLQKHIRQFGADGRFTFHAGLTVEEAAAPGIVEAVKRSTLHDFATGDLVVIRGTTEAVEVEKVCGMFLILRSYGDGSCNAFRRVDPPHGRYSYGRIHIYKGHVEPHGRVYGS